MQLLDWQRVICGVRIRCCEASRPSERCNARYVICEAKEREMRSDVSVRYERRECARYGSANSRQDEI